MGTLEPNQPSERVLKSAGFEGICFYACLGAATSVFCHLYKEG